MVLVSYDITDNKLRTSFAKFLTKFGHRIQYSIFEIDNSERMLHNIISEIQNKYAMSFGETDSIYIFKLNPNCHIIRYGYAKHDEEDFLIV